MIDSKTFNLTALPPLSLYIHIPWCVKKCPYCDFNSHKSPNSLPEDAYIKALITDLEQALPLIWGRTINTIFIGGGTPSLFSAEQIGYLLAQVRKLTRLSPFAEITLEANPGTVDNEHLSGYSEAGVNRLSIGVQSFNDKHLKGLGRIHDADAAVNAIKIAAKKFSLINIDLMYGLPNQTIDELKSDLNTALSFKLEHLSYYNLTIEPNTFFASYTPGGLPDNDLCYVMQQAITEELQKEGYKRYETSAYARDNKFCAHNLNYWRFGDYLGIGAGAHSKLSFHERIIRQVRQKHPQSYMDSVVNGKHIIEDKIVPLNELAFEFMLNALRLIDGFELSLFTERSGLSLNTVLAKLLKAQDEGYLILKDNRVVPTIKGQDFLNDLLLMYV